MKTSLDRSVSFSLFELAKLVIPGGVNSPVRSFPHMQMHPIVIDKGKGSRLYDVDGHSFIDFCQGWGSLILGHSPDSVMAAVQERLQNGWCFGMLSKEEIAIATHLQERIPFLEKIRFVSSGTEAVMSALRLARGYTGRNKVLKFDGNYHGHSDSLLVSAGSGVVQLPKASSLGIPEATLSMTLSSPYNDIEAAFSIMSKEKDLAAVILEPIAANMGVVPAAPSFLAMLREETQKRGIVLIFDEVISGFRPSFDGARGLYGIDPDLITFGKIIGGGFPAAAFGGRGEILSLLAPLGGVYQAGTLSGSPIAMAAGLATLQQLTTPFYDLLEKKSQRVVTPVQEFIKKQQLKACCQRVGSMWTLFLGMREVGSKVSLDENLYGSLFRFLFHRGIFFPPSPYEACFVSAAHTEEELDFTAKSIIEFLSHEPSIS